MQMRKKPDRIIVKLVDCSCLIVCNLFLMQML